MDEPEIDSSNSTDSNLRRRVLLGAASVFVIACFCLLMWFILRPRTIWSGWLHYKIVPSPNFNQRPIAEDVNCIVLHATANDLLSKTILRFENPKTKVSAHFVVDKDGTIIQMVPLTKRAWHAGVSSFDGVYGVNDYSIGIEMTNMNNGKDPYPEAQYLAVARLIHNIRRHYNIPNNRIVSHAEIALPAGRKVDPKGFDFPRLMRMLH